MTQIDIAIVGAGMAGLTCAQILQQAGYRVVVLEKSRGVGGRLATRRLPQARVDHIRVDHGTCYISPQDEWFQHFIQSLADRGVVHVWTDQVYELAADGTLQAPAVKRNRYVAGEGMSAIAKELIPNLEIQFNQRVVQLAAIADHWQLTLEASPQAASPGALTQLAAKAIIIAIPAPQAAELLATLPTTALPPDFVTQVQAVEFTPCISVMAGYPAPCLTDWQQRYGPVKAIAVQTADIGWLGLDSSKRATAPEQPVFVLQSEADFATRCLDAADLMPVGRSLLHTASTLFAPWLAEPEWMQVHRWRYAFARSPLPDAYLSAPTIAPLLCAGDWCGGMRVETAMRSGVEVAHAVNRQLDQRPLSDLPCW